MKTKNYICAFLGLAILACLSLSSCSSSSKLTSCPTFKNNDKNVQFAFNKKKQNKKVKNHYVKRSTNQQDAVEAEKVAAIEPLSIKTAQIASVSETIELRQPTSNPSIINTAFYTKDIDKIEDNIDKTLVASTSNALITSEKSSITSFAKEVKVADEVAAGAMTKKELRKSIKAQKKELRKAAKANGKGKSQLVALLLVIFVGVLGIHRFYLGYPIAGIIQLLTLGGFGIWALIDLIMIITGDLKPKDGDYTETL